MNRDRIRKQLIRADINSETVVKLNNTSSSSGGVIGIVGWSDRDPLDRVIDLIQSANGTSFIVETPVRGQLFSNSWQVIKMANN
jgi:hypothetical protein